MAEIYDKNKQNAEMTRLQNIANQFDIQDINNISDTDRQRAIQTIESELKRRQKQNVSTGGNIIGDVIKPFTSRKTFFINPQTGQVQSEDVGLPTSSSPIKDLLDLETLKSKKELEDYKIRQEKVKTEQVEQEAKLKQVERERKQAKFGLNGEPIDTVKTSYNKLSTIATEVPMGARQEVIKEISPEGEIKTEFEVTPEEAAKREGMKRKRVKWDEEAAERQIKFEVLDPKLQYYMDVGGRAYKELKDEVKEKFNIDLNFEKGGIEALKSMAVKSVATRAKIAPLMVALERLRPELGTELMRQLGAFRSAEMAQRFAATLAQFSGDIREDIANMTTTMIKNAANVELVDEDGNVIPTDETLERMKSAEANLIRIYNKLYRGMELTTKPYTAGRSIEWLAENSNYNNKEKEIIENAMADNPNSSALEVTSALIQKGVL